MSVTVFPKTGQSYKLFPFLGQQTSRMQGTPATADIDIPEKPHVYCMNGRLAAESRLPRLGYWKWDRPSTTSLSRSAAIVPFQRPLFNFISSHETRPYCQQRSYRVIWCDNASRPLVPPSRLLRFPPRLLAARQHFSSATPRDQPQWARSRAGSDQIKRPMADHKRQIDAAEPPARHGCQHDVLSIVRIVRARGPQPWAR
ncbi:hypothetical protein K456DRAFT_1337806 [Colletotrichum gloeosporioides 23]|nr:hypothetical protein K456DRAFT_1337806 [Colletotrichum gloeosporioides 23]